MASAEPIARHHDQEPGASSRRPDEKRRPMSLTFFEHPILNSPYAYPARHWEVDADGQPTNALIESRRRSELITPVPKAKKRMSPKVQVKTGPWRRRRRPEHGRTEIRSHAHHQRAARVRRHLASTSLPAAMASHAGDGTPAAALASSQLSGRAPVLLSDRGGRDSHLADHCGAAFLQSS